MKKYLYIIVIAIAFFIAAYIYINTPSNKFKDFDYTEKKIIIYEGEILQDHSPLFIDDEIYLPYNFINKFIDENIFFDEGFDLITVTYNNQLKRIDDSLFYDENDMLYLSVKILTEIYPVHVTKTPFGVFIEDDRRSKEKIVLIKSTFLRHAPKIKSPYMEKLNQNDQLIVISDGDDWLKVLSSENKIGYIEKDDGHDIYVIQATASEKEISRMNLGGKKVFAWEMMYSYPEDPSGLQIFTDIDILSPTWIELKNENGDISTRIVPDYVTRLSEEGIMVIPCITNRFDDPEMTSNFLRDPFARETFIVSIVDLCKLYKFAGINIDFENIFYKNKEDFTQFIREMSYYTHTNGLVLSVSTGVTGGSMNYSLVYDHKKICEYSDYIMLMAYDELPYTGPEYGPVASFEWIERKILDLLKLVDSDKVFLGIPLYTRVWDVTDESKYTSIPVSIRRQNEILLENTDGVFETDEKYEQRIFKYNKEDTDYLMYLEDNSVISNRMDIIEKYGLAGAAFWAKNYVDEEFFIELGK